MISKEARLEITKQIRRLLVRNGVLKAGSRINFVKRIEKGLYSVNTAAGPLRVDLTTQTWS